MICYEALDPVAQLKRKITWERLLKDNALDMSRVSKRNSKCSFFFVSSVSDKKGLGGL